VPSIATTRQFAMATPVADELTFGVARLPDSRRKAFLAEWLEETLGPIPFFRSIWLLHNGTDVSEHAAWLLGYRRPWVDGQIAAIAVVNGLILVTRNTNDFDGYLDIQVDNWFTPASRDTIRTGNRE